VEKIGVIKMDDLEIVAEMAEYVRDKKIRYISGLWVYAEKERADDWFVVLRKKKYYRVLKLLINSRRFSGKV